MASESFPEAATLFAQLSRAETMGIVPANSGCGHDDMQPLLSYTSLHINTTKACRPLTGCTYATPSSSRLPSKSSPHEGKPHVSGQTSTRSIYSDARLAGPNIHPHQTKFQ
jgi:hypothetical protein